MWAMGSGSANYSPQLLELVEDELNLRSDDDLHRGLARADNAGSTGGLDLLLVNQQAVLDFQSQTGDAVVDGEQTFSLPPRPSMMISAIAV